MWSNTEEANRDYYDDRILSNQFEVIYDGSVILQSQWSSLIEQTLSSICISQRLWAIGRQTTERSIQRSVKQIA